MTNQYVFCVQINYSFNKARVENKIRKLVRVLLKM